MKPLSVPNRMLQAGLAVAILATASLGHAQTRAGIRQATQPTGPSFGARLATPAPSGLTAGSAPATRSAQSAAGLVSALPSPSGLTAGSGAVLTTPSTLATVDGNAAASAAAADATTGIAAGVYSGAAVAASPATGSYGVPAGRATTGTGGGPFTALQLAQSFLSADANRDGELTRAEFMRLTIVPYSFEEMDRNKDGILTRFEYEDAVRS